MDINFDFQMEPGLRNVILKAMPYIIKHLDVNASFLSQFEANGILDVHSVEKILVSLM